MRIKQGQFRSSKSKKVTGEAVERAINIKGDIPGTPGLIFKPEKK